MSSEPVAKQAKMEHESAATKPTDKTIEELKAKVNKVADQKPAHQIACSDSEVKDPATIDINYDHNNSKDSVDGSIIKFKKLSSHALIPARGSPLAAGFDLFSAHETTIKAGGHGLVKTDIAVQLPYGSYGRVAPRSGLAYKKFINIGAGVVDVDYRGNVGVVVFNHYHEDFVVKYGDRVAQLVIEKIFMPSVVVTDELTDTERGAGGYGSTGK